MDNLRIAAMMRAKFPVKKKSIPNQSLQLMAIATKRQSRKLKKWSDKRQLRLFSE